MNHILFVTDSFTEKEGFEVEYAPYQSNCGGELEATDKPQAGWQKLINKKSVKIFYVSGISTWYFRDMVISWPL